MFYVEDDHDAIISKQIWECVQLEIKRRKKYLEEHGTNSYSHRPESNPFASKIICENCNKVFARKSWRSSTGVDRKVWQYSERYKVKGVISAVSPMAIVAGLWIIIIATGLIITFVPAIAITEAPKQQDRQSSQSRCLYNPSACYKSGQLQTHRHPDCLSIR